MRKCFPVRRTTKLSGLSFPRELTLIVLLTFNFIGICGQVISGTVLDIKTKEPIGFAYLYFSGTFAGTQSDVEGNFELDVTNVVSRPLTVSAIGYYSVTLANYKTGKPLKIYLEPKLYELKEVNINARSLARKRKSNLYLFKNEFLGTTNNANDCKILNENDISFNYESDHDTLKAYASKPLKIENKSLGYTITYYLDKFEYVRQSKTFFFRGNIIFNEDLGAEGVQKETYERRRKYAYLGSRMQFFRSLWYDDLKSTGFVIKNLSEEILKYKDLVIQDAVGNKYLVYNNDLEIYYYSKVPLSTIKFLRNKVLFGKDGFFDPSAIAWEGKMADLRIADWLPYEYSLKE